MCEEIARLFRQLTHGVYVIGVAHGEVCNAFTAAWMMQVSFNPLLLALSINTQHSSYGLLTCSRVFSVNVLSQDQLDLAAHFGRPAAENKLATVQWCRKLTGAPVLTGALAYFDCELSHSCPAGDHELVIGRVVDGAVLNADALPLNYRDTGDLDGSSRLYPDAF
jgi:flavin reductase (DIM6/NTAB) family NADH-FMN oxidoreductase RutF